MKIVNNNSFFYFDSITQKDKIESWLLIFAIYLIPFLQYTGLLPNIITTLGTNVISFVLLVFLWVSKIGRRKYFAHNKLLDVSVVVLFLYMIYALFRSCNLYGPYETFVIFRRNFIGGLSLLFGVFYIQKFNPKCLPYVVHWIIVLCLLQAVLYICHALGLLHLYSGLEGVMTEGGVSVNRTYAGIPKCLTIVGCLIVWSYIERPKTSKLLLVGIIIVSVILTYTRSSFVQIFITLTLFVLALVLRRIIKIGTLSKMILTVSLLASVICLIMPNSLSFWTARFATTQEEMKYKVGTYDFRQKLVDSSIEEIERKDILSGMGYVHDSEAGDYSIVLGGDTYVAPVIYCEGLLGIFLRVFVYLPLALYAFRKWSHSKSRPIIAASSLILVFIIVNTISYMQTACFTEYQTSFLILLLIYYCALSNHLVCKS